VSTCTCRTCRACCQHLPGALTLPGDLERIEAATRQEGESEEAWSERLFVASDGALIESSATGERVNVPTLAFRSTLKGACMFYRQGRCAVYDARPSACSEFDCSQTDQEAHTLSVKLCLERRDDQQKGGRYWEIWERLHAMGKRRSMASLRKRRRKMEKR
jgi:Fe-S-cluster containining protein